MPELRETGKSGIQPAADECSIVFLKDVDYAAKGTKHSCVCRGIRESK